MTCPECGYDGDEWLHDAVKRSDGWNGYICPRCNHHMVVKVFTRYAKLPDGTPPDASMWGILSRIKLDIPDEQKGSHNGQQR